MPITEECSVVKVKGDYAVIELSRKPECEGCKACAFNRRNTIRMTAKKEIDCEAGDRVIVQMPEKSIKGSWIILFALPLLFILTAVIITAKFAWYLQITAIGIALLMGFGCAVLCDFLIRRRTKYIPIVKNTLKENKNLIGEDTND